MKLIRSENNPILSPNDFNDWENVAVFNPTVIKNNDGYHMFYRAIGSEKIINGKKLRPSSIGYAKSIDGVNFSSRKLFISPELEWEKYGVEDPRVTFFEGKYYLFYTAISNYPPNHLGIKTGLAILDENFNILEKHLVTPFNSKGMTLFSARINGKITVMLTVNTDKPPSIIAYAQMDEISDLWDVRFWNYWYENYLDFKIDFCRINSDQVEVGASPIYTKYGWLIIYSYIKNYFTDKPIFRIESALLNLTNPQQIIGRIEESLLIPEEKYELFGFVKSIVFPEAAIIENEKLNVYYGAADNYIAMASADINDFFKNFAINAPEVLHFEKFRNNPLLQPIENHPWESKAVFNPAALEINGIVYLIYRTLSSDNISRMGLAISTDGLYIDERLPDPIYSPRTQDEKNGCEDPRVTIINDDIYMCYTAYDGITPRIAMTHISKKDFLDRKWDKWSMPKLITKPNEANKDGALFPEKINGKYAFFHRLEPDMYIDYVDDLNFENNQYLNCEGKIETGQKFWDGLKIGINNPPIKTDFGWLVFYHGVSLIDHNYRLGAVLLDLVDPTRTIARTLYPILEPELYFEKEGVVNNVVFPCGHIIKNGEIYLYYGGADRVVCGAKINMQELLDYLIRSNNKKFLEI